MLPDYAEFEQAIGLDWYRDRPEPGVPARPAPPRPGRAGLRRGARRAVRCRWWAGTIAPRAEETDKHGPVLRRYDRWG